MTAELADGSMVLNLDGYQTTSDFFILDNSHHPYTRPFDGYPNIPQIGDTCDRLIVCDGTPIVSLAGYYENDVPNWIYFPFYFAQANFQNPSDINYSKTSEKFNSISKTHRFSCLNRNPKNERIWFYTKLHQTPLFSDTFTSFYTTYTWGQQLTMRRLNIDLDADTFNYFTKYILPTLPHGTPEDINVISNKPGYFGRDIQHVAFSDTYVNIISEHLYEECFLSEKTVKPLAAEQLFLMAGPPNAIRHLEELGFDVFRDYIPHDLYDSEPDWQKRLLKMLEVANELNTKDIHQIFVDTKSRREHNREYLFSGKFKDVILRPFTEWIEKTVDKRS